MAYCFLAGRFETFLGIDEQNGSGEADQSWRAQEQVLASNDRMLSTNSRLHCFVSIIQGYGLGPVPFPFPKCDPCISGGEELFALPLTEYPDLDKTRKVSRSKRLTGILFGCDLLS